MNLQSRMRGNFFNESSGHLKFKSCLKKLVYNNFPWPESATAKQRAAVEAKAQAVLAAREQFMGQGGTGCQPVAVGNLPTVSVRQVAGQHGQVGRATQTNCTLANLYDPLAMPPALAKAHAELDRAVDLCYRPEKFESDRQRVEYLFSLYEKLTAPLLPAAKTKKARRSG